MHIWDQKGGKDFILNKTLNLGGLYSEIRPIKLNNHGKQSNWEISQIYLLQI